MKIPMFDQSKESPEFNMTFEGEAVRLSNEIRAKRAKSFIDEFGNRINIPAKRGFDCETANFMTMVNWLADTRIKKSESLISFVHRIMAVRFPTEYAQHRDKINVRYKLEYEMIQSKATNDIEFFGKSGFSGLTRFDGSLTDNRNRLVKSRNGTIRIKRK